jgi:hypothetical protein
VGAAYPVFLHIAADLGYSRSGTECAARERMRCVILRGHEKIPDNPEEDTPEEETNGRGKKREDCTAFAIHRKASWD